MRLSLNTGITAAIAAGAAILVVLGFIVDPRLAYIGSGVGIALLVSLIFLVDRYRSDRRQSRIALSESEARFGKLMDLSSNFYWETDADHRLVSHRSEHTNLDEATAQRGGAQGGKPRWESPYLSPDEAGWRAHRAELDAHLPFRGFEFSRLGVDGKAHYIEISGDPVFDSTGAFKGYHGIGTNITERKRREEDLRHFRVAMDATIDSIYVTDLATMRFVEVNGAACRRLGYTRDELLKLGPQDVLVADREQLRRTYDEVIAAGEQGTSAETHYLTRDGRSGWTELHRRALRSDSGWLIVTLGRDITERKNAEQALRDSERELRLITDAVPAVITYADADERMRFCNIGMARLVDRPPELIIQRSMREIFGEDRYRALEPYVRRALAGEDVHFQYTQANADGDLLDLSVKYLPRRNERGEVEGFYTLATDITEIRRLERLKSEFVSTVSHELRTPLTSIRGSLGLLSGGVAGALPEKARGLIEIAKSNCERLIRLINDMLDIEKIESGKMTFNLRSLELMELIEQVARANDGFAVQHGVRLQVTAAVPEAKIQGDGDRLAQVLTNLISNACKFSPCGSSVDIAVSRQGDQLRVEVTDHGPGISEEFRKRIFQKFSQADTTNARKEGGTGLGLSISKAIIERLGGRIGFFSEPGKGATFYFELPQWREGSPSVPVAPAARDVPAATDARPRVLVCEDDPDVAKLIQLMLQNAGLASDIAYDAAQAKALLLRQRYAAMTLDLMLPDQDGLSLIRELRTAPEMAHLPVIVVSATAEEGKLKLHGENLEVIDWIDKPIDENRLLDNLRRVQGAARMRVLHVEDDPDLRRVVSTIAHDIADFEPAESVRDATARLSREHFDMVLLDLGLPDGSGWELLQLINRMTPRPRVVIFSAHDAGADHGQNADPYLVKSQTSEQQLIDTIRGAFNAAA
jgi:PAS domain S-box-containing protein